MLKRILMVVMIAAVGAGCEKKDEPEADAVVQLGEKPAGSAEEPKVPVKAPVAISGPPELVLAQVAKSHRADIQQCYAKNLELDPMLGGKIVIEWSIRPDGVVSVVKIKENTMKTPHVAMCVSALIKNWKYPSPWEGTKVVTQSFAFHSVGQSGADPKKTITPEEKAEAAKMLLDLNKTKIGVTSLNAKRIDIKKHLVKIPIDGLVIRGMLAKSTAREIAETHQKEIRRCYTLGIARDPDLRGKLVMQWVVETDGTVRVVKTKKNLFKTPHMSICVSKVIKKWKYPPLKDGIAIVDQEFVFTKSK